MHPALLRLQQLRQNAPRPLARHLVISLVTCFLLFVSFLLFLLVALSLPVTKSVYLFSIQFTPYAGIPADATADTLRFGVWGLCATGELAAYEYCYGPTLGYTIPQEILNITGYAGLVDAVVEGLTVLLVLHPVCAAMSFVVMFTSLFLESHAMCIFSLVTAVLTLVLACLVFAADIALVLVARTKVPQLSAFAYQVNWGPAVWMVLAAVVVLWVGMILLSVVVCECCGVGEQYKDTASEDRH